MPVGKRESMDWRDCAKVFRDASRLSESEHGPLVADISQLGTPFLDKPHIGRCISPDYDLLDMTLQGYEIMVIVNKIA